jgi:hypothetical protein
MVDRRGGHGSLLGIGDDSLPIFRIVGNTPVLLQS